VNIFRRTTSFLLDFQLVFIYIFLKAYFSLNVFYVLIYQLFMKSDYKEIWQQVLDSVQQKIPHESFLTWFGPLRCLDSDNSILNIGVPNRFFYEFLEAHYRKQISEAIEEISSGDLKIKYHIMPAAKSGKVSPKSQIIEPVNRPLSGYDEKTQINPRYSFDNFVEGDGNSFAKAAALAVAEAPGKTPFNPLFIYGSTGLGKTHLLQAVGNFAVSNKKAKRILFATSEKFMNDFIFAIKAYKTTDFSRTYRSVDILLLDDIQFFQGKERTQLEFFHTFNSLYQAGKQIVLTSDRPHKELDDFDKRLISRIGWGLVSDIQPPDFETRLAIVQKRADQEGISLPDDVAEFLSRSIKENIRELESAMIRLVAHCSITGTDLNLPLAKEVLKDLIQEPIIVISIDLIQHQVADHFKIPYDSLIARNRKKDVAHARQIAMFLCTELTNSSLQSIGLHFGNRDHSTVIHARNMISHEITSNTEFGKEIDKLRAKMSG